MDLLSSIPNVSPGCSQVLVMLFKCPIYMFARFRFIQNEYIKILKCRVEMFGIVLSKIDECVWLLEQQKRVPLPFTSGKWNENGPADAIRSFFDYTLRRFRQIDDICTALEHYPADPQTVGSCVSGYLGQGALVK